MKNKLKYQSHRFKELSKLFVAKKEASLMLSKK